MKNLILLFLLAATTAAMSQQALARVVQKPGRVGILFVGSADRSEIDANLAVNDMLERRPLMVKNGLNPFGTTTFIRPGSIVELETNINLHSHAAYFGNSVIDQLSKGDLVRILTYDVSYMSGNVAAVVELVEPEEE